MKGLYSGKNEKLIHQHIAFLRANLLDRSLESKFDLNVDPRDYESFIVDKKDKDVRGTYQSIDGYTLSDLMVKQAVKNAFLTDKVNPNSLLGFLFYFTDDYAVLLKGGKNPLGFNRRIDDRLFISDYNSEIVNSDRILSGPNIFFIHKGFNLVEDKHIFSNSYFMAFRKAGSFSWESANGVFLCPSRVV